MKSFSARAFTLLELLVVTVILGLLAAMWLPALNGARAAAKRSVCASNMRQIGLATLAFAEDHGGLFPATTHGGPISNSWIFTLAPYLANVDAIRICPADPRAPERTELKLTSYVVNEYVAVPLMDPFGQVIESFQNLHRLKDPSHTITVFIGADNLGLSVTSDHTHSRLWHHNWNQVIADIQPDRHRAGRAVPDRSQGSANYLHADSHVETVRAAVRKAQILGGHNFAKPPS